LKAARQPLATLLAIVCLAAPFGAAAVEPDEMLADPVLEARAIEISKELRCVVCQNQTIDGSNAPLARDMRLLVRERLVAGDTDAQAKQYLVARYGNFVLLKPPFQKDTLILWLGPLAILIAAAVALILAAKSGAPAESDLEPEED
jgi:cytochrome c-type biogenesis protein CcmH